MKKHSINFIISFFAMICTVSAQRGNRTKELYRKGLEIVAASFEAMGGQNTLDKIEDVSYTLAGMYYARNQSYLPDTPFEKFSIESRVFHSLKNERVLWEEKNGLRDGTFFSSRTFANNNGGYNLIYNRRSYTTLPPDPPVLQLANRLLPVFFLRKILAHKVTLRLIDNVVIDGKKEAVVCFYFDNQQFTAYFDGESKFLKKYEVLEPDATTGDQVVSFCYDDYRSFEGLLLPTRFTQLIAGAIIEQDSCLNFKFNLKPDEAFFKLPEGYPLFQTTSFAMKPLAKDVFLAEGLAGGRYRCLIVALNDGILVVDAPINSYITTQLITGIKKTIPNKPIKYIVATHHHDDHTGGIRSFIAEGAKIVTTQRNKKYFEQVANAEFTLEPDALSRQMKNPDFLFVEKSKKIEYAGGTVEIYKLDKNLHAKDLYVVYLPKEKILFQSDLYNLQTNAVNKATVDFMEEITPLDWQPEIVIGSHSGAVSFEQIRKEVKEFLRTKK